MDEPTRSVDRRTWSAARPRLNFENSVYLLTQFDEGVDDPAQVGSEESCVVLEEVCQDVK